MLKSNIAWMKKNVPSDLKVWKGMIQDIDWSQVAAKTKLSLQRDKDRITAEFKEFAAMDTSAKIDWLMNGDRHLGYLYKKDAIAFARREWKGLKSVGYDFVGWLKIWGGMLNMVMKDPHVHYAGRVRVSLVRFLPGHPGCGRPQRVRPPRQAAAG